LDYPRTFDQVMETAAKLHHPGRGISGIGWNSARGLPIASTFMIFLGCCGASLLHRPIGRTKYDWSALHCEELRPNILCDEARTVLGYMSRLLPYSPLNILELEWDGQLDTFMAGQLAISYCWSMRAARFEYEVASRIKRRVAYLAQPKGPGGKSADPVGGFHLAIPQNIGDEDARLAFEAITW
jgi:multiple sugar transport system substrate-binding protein